ncbi:MAG: hypothetical protein HUJ75_02875, partial [Parasporobacterium sp.]|nr:hypothetical protein [Parasporobacterium sp.]
NEYYEYAPEGYEGDAIWMTLKKTGYVDETEVDMATTVKTHCGKHAVTCCGYVTCKDASGKETLVSLFIADSDSDANIYTTVKEADSDVKRPDVISAFPLEISDEEFGNTCLLKGYSDILIATISELTLINGPEK